MSVSSKTRTLWPMVDVSRRVLAVDDDPAVLRVLARLLGRAGLEVQTARSGEEALAALETFRPEVVISDQRMPGMDGVEFLEQVHRRMPETQRILLTAHADVQAIDAAIARGRIYRFLTKPWDNGTMLSVVHSALVHYDLERENRRLVDLTKRQNQELKELNRTLEQRIDQRTALLTQTKRQWEVTFDSIADPLMIVTRDYRVVRANRAMAQDVGLPVTGPPGQLCHQLRAASAAPFSREEGRPCHGCPVGEVLAGAPSAQRELIGPSRRHYRISAFGMAPGAGLEDNIVCIYRDVTEERAFQGQVAQTEKLAALGQLAGGVAHEINNPLGGILAFAQIALRNLGEGSPAREDLEEIEKNALRCKRIVERLLRFGRMSRPEERRPVDLNELVDETLAMVERQYRNRGVAVERALAPAPVLVLGNANQIEQVLLNLAQNAVDAMPEGGTIRVATYAAPDGGAVAVGDTGTGISEEHLRKIFDPFFTTKPEGQGTGLGLAVSYGIVRDHGGRIEVESQVDQGTTFTVFLPPAPATAVPGAQG